MTVTYVRHEHRLAQGDRRVDPDGRTYVRFQRYRRSRTRGWVPVGNKAAGFAWREVPDLDLFRQRVERFVRQAPDGAEIVLRSGGQPVDLADMVPLRCADRQSFTVWTVPAGQIEPMPAHLTCWSFDETCAILQAVLAAPRVRLRCG